MSCKKKLHILGIRGIPAQHGGFETFAQQLSFYLVKQGWDVTVYCQAELCNHNNIIRDEWQGVKRVRIPVKDRGNFTSVVFDWQAIKLAAKEEGVSLILGYNTAIFSAYLRLKGRKILFNMDGLEWKRSVWPLHGRIWFYFNEWIGSWLGHHLIADNPHIEKHLYARFISRDKVTMIPYGARAVEKGEKPRILKELDDYPYALVIARPVPENHVLEIVQAWGQEKRNCFLVVLGHLDSKTPYHQAIQQAAGEEVKLVGAIYDSDKVDALRLHAHIYIHGHSVGGTNPSLVEALGAGNAVLAHDNPFNRWVAQSAAEYFKNGSDLPDKITTMLADQVALQSMRAYARTRFTNTFRWQNILKSYEKLLTNFI